MSMEIQSNNGGQFMQFFAGGNTTASNTAAAGGRLCKVAISNFATGTAAVTIYDGTNQTAGSLVYTISATAASASTGAPLDLQFPISTGIFILGTTGSPALAISYNKSGPNGAAPVTTN